MISITPESALFDQAVKITLSNLPINSEIKCEALLKDENQQPWFLSHAIFKSDANGEISIATEAPISGTYSGVDPMGLFWSMQPAHSTAEFCTIKGDECSVFLKVSHNNKTLFEKTFHRDFATKNIITKEINNNGVVGILSYPENAKNLPAIITVSGSGGGASLEMAQMLASHGYAVLALGYFGMPGLPEFLENIPMEYFENAIRWFKSQPQVDAKRVALRGASYGGELVLLLGSLFPDEFCGIVALTPPSLIFGGFPYSNEPAWTYKNKPISPFIGGLTNTDINLTEAEDLISATKQKIIPFHQGTFEDPYIITPLFLARIKKHDPDYDNCSIPVEKIKCPLLVISYEADDVHPAKLHGDIIMKRLDAHHSTINRKHISFKNSGHSPRTPYEPKTNLPWYLMDGLWCSAGGTISGNAIAAREGCAEMLEFLKYVFQKVV